MTPTRVVSSAPAVNAQSREAGKMWPSHMQLLGEDNNNNNNNNNNNSGLLNKNNMAARELNICYLQ